MEWWLLRSLYSIKALKTPSIIITVFLWLFFLSLRLIIPIARGHPERRKRLPGPSRLRCVTNLGTTRCAWKCYVRPVGSGRGGQRRALPSSRWLHCRCDGGRPGIHGGRSWRSRGETKHSETAAAAPHTSSDCAFRSGNSLRFGRPALGLPFSSKRWWLGTRLFPSWPVLPEVLISRDPS